MHRHPRDDGITTFDAVSPAELHPVDVERLGQPIHRLLDAPVDFRHAKPSHWPPDGMVGVDAVGVGMHVGDIIGAGGRVARRARDVDAILGVGAGVPVVFHLKRLDRPIPGAADFHTGSQPLPHERAEELFLTGHAHLDRPAGDSPGHDDSQRLHGNAGLGAESSTHVVANDPHVSLGNAQRLRNQIALGEGGLRAAPQGDLTRCVPTRHCHVWLDGNVLNMGNAVGLFDDRITLGPGRLYVALAHPEDVGDVRSRLGKNERDDLVCVEVGVQERRIREDRFQRIEDSRQFFVFHLDEPDGIFGDLLAGRDDAGDRVAHVARPVPAKDVAILQIQPDAPLAYPRR